METIEDKLREYAKLKEQEKLVAAKLEELKPEIKEYLIKQGVDKLPTTAGTFAISEMRTWKYSENVTKLQEAEKANGTAKAIVSTSLRFTPPKDTDGI